MTARKTSSLDLGQLAAAINAGRPPAVGVMVKGSALHDCDALSNDLCQKIIPLAETAITRLTPKADDLVAARELLLMVSVMADDLMNSINVLAEQQGCIYVDHAREAFRAAVSKQGGAA